MTTNVPVEVGQLRMWIGSMVLSTSSNLFVVTCVTDSGDPRGAALVNILEDGSISPGYTLNTILLDSVVIK